MCACVRLYLCCGAVRLLVVLRERVAASCSLSSGDRVPSQAKNEASELHAAPGHERNKKWAGIIGRQRYFSCATIAHLQLASETSHVFCCAYFRMPCLAARFSPSSPPSCLVLSL